jgi:hypothetical protein
METINLGKGLVETRGPQPNVANDDFENSQSFVMKASTVQVIVGCSQEIESNISVVFINGC